ncbi:MAG: AAA family ATPase [Planctomycetota bacterium]
MTTPNTPAAARGLLRYECDVCGRKVPQYRPQCPKCLHWDTFRRCKPQKPPQKASAGIVKSTDPVRGYAVRRVSCGLAPVDKVLCGGFVKGRSHVLSGDPGAGKSTLALGVAGGFARGGKTVLYVCGEEGVGAVQHRAQRVKAAHAKLLLTPVVETDGLKAVIEESGASAVFFDSVQMLYNPAVKGDPGEVKQIKETVKILAPWCNARRLVSVFLAHVTKGGKVGGPQFFKHMTDVSLELKVDDQGIRELHSRKNRDGGTDYVGRLRMTAAGLTERE